MRTQPARWSSRAPPTSLARTSSELKGDIKTTATLEVQITNTQDSTSWTPLQVPCTVRDDLISLST